MKIIAIAAAIVGALVMLVQPVVAQDSQKGAEALERGDYATVLREFEALGEQGVADAQNSLDFMYENGQGVTQDDAQSVKWLRLAAEQGYASAQNNLGLMYAKGRGVTQDYVQAHMWFNLAAALGDKNSAKNRDIFEKSMTTADISKAQRMARQWRPGQQSAVPRSSGPTAADKRIANVQRDLAALGYDPGPVDGILGPKTRSAIRAFQGREKRPVTGVVSEELAAALQSVSGAGQARKAVQ